jgi:putative protease
MSGSGKNTGNIEVMAPVGSWESLTAAVQGGADSVYFGLEKLNMRARSSINFSADDLPGIVNFCRENGVKSYLTLNTILYDSDIPVMEKLIDAAAETGVSAVIVSDQSAIEYASVKGVEIHLSTQLNISNYQALKFYSRFADVAVLARELNLDQIRGIYNRILKEDLRGPSGELVRLELFVHGALCMAVSGKCYLSLHQYNYSANRGSCLQACRRGYTVTDRESGDELEIDNEYIMSPKDLSTIGFLDKIIDSGISVLKIEGRARPPEYVKTVSKCYKEAVESVKLGNYRPEKIIEWETRLKQVFNRGFWDGYYLGQRLGEWSSVYGSKATKRKEYLGKGNNYFPNIGVGEFIMETKSLTVGEEVLITGPTTGVIEMKIEELRVDDRPVEEVKKGDRFSMKVGKKIRKSDKLFKWKDA